MNNSYQNRNKWQSIGARIMIVIFYFSIILIFLYLPLIKAKFFSSKNNVLNICCFTELFSEEIVARFEKETGISVNFNYVECDEDIYAKFKVNEGRGYDLVIASDFMVKTLSQENFLQKIDLSHVALIDELDQRLMNHSFDAHNNYSIPYKWFTLGIVYDKNFFNEVPDSISLDLVFKDPLELFKQGKVKAPYKVCMIESAIDCFYMAALFLFNKAEVLTDKQIKEVQQLLIKQKKWVECYTWSSVDYFLFSEVSPIAITSSYFVPRIVDMVNHFEFAIPKEGGILVIENIIIPKHTQKLANIYTFINFMLSEQIASEHTKEFRWFSSHKNSLQHCGEKYKTLLHLFPNKAIFSRLLVPLYSQEMQAIINDVWLHVGFA